MPKFDPITMCVKILHRVKQVSKFCKRFAVTVVEKFQNIMIALINIFEAFNKIATVKMYFWVEIISKIKPKAIPINYFILEILD